MDFQRIYYFRSVAKHMNFTKAAEECHIAQTAMSRAIANLEEELGFKLFYRDHHSVELTPAGKYFLEQMSEMISFYSVAMQTSSEIANGSDDTIFIAFGGYESGFLKEYIPQFLKAYPSCSVVLLEYPYQSLVQELIERNCDVIFVPSIRLEKSTSIRKIIVAESRYSIVANKDHWVSKYDTIKPELLSGETFICPSDKTQNWLQLEAFHKICDSFNMVPGKLIYSNTSNAIMNMIEMNLGITLLSSSFYNCERYNAKNITLDIDTDLRKTHMVASLEKPRRPIVSLFMDFMEDTISRQGYKA